MSKPQLSQVMKDLYGSEATQCIRGGKKDKSSFIKDDVLEGSLPIAEYLDNSDIQLFIHTFYLNKCFMEHRVNIVVIPPHDILTKMVSEMLKILKNNKIEPNTTAACKYIATQPLEYKRYLFTAKADSSDEHFYLQSKQYYKPFDYIKRTNWLNEQYYFKYKSPTELIVSSQLDNNEGTTIKVIERCSGKLFIFQGPLPKPIEHYKATNMKGGYINLSLTKFNKLKDMIDKDGEDCCSKFISMYYKSNKNKSKVFNKMFGGDLLHTAFRICFNDNITEPPQSVTTTESNELIGKLVDQYTPNTKELDVNKFENALHKVYAKSMSTDSTSVKELSRNYINDLVQIYKNVGKDMLCADLATNMYRSDAYKDLSEIYSVANQVNTINEKNDNLKGGNINDDDLSNTSIIEFSNNSDNYYITSELNKCYNELLLSNPMYGLKSRSLYPLLKNNKEDLIDNSNYDEADSKELDLSDQIDEDNTIIEIEDNDDSIIINNKTQDDIVDKSDFDETNTKELDTDEESDPEDVVEFNHNAEITIDSFI